MTFVFFSLGTRTLLTHWDEKGAGEENKYEEGGYLIRGGFT